MQKFFPSMKMANTACFMSIMAIENAFQRTACGKPGPRSQRYDKLIRNLQKWETTLYSPFLRLSREYFCKNLTF